MALRRGIETVYFACRSEAKARIAKEELERATGKSVFKVVFVDVSDVSGGGDQPSNPWNRSTPW